MISFEINDNRISKCKINEEELEFIDGVAICEADVIRATGENYKTLTLLKKDESKDDSQVSYSIESGISVLALDEDVVNIVRSGRHFIIEKNAHNFDKTRFYKEFHQIDLVDNYDKKRTFVEKPKIPCLPIPTTNESVVIIKSEEGRVCLYSLDKADIVSNEFSELEGIDDKTFLVTDTVSSNYNAELVEQLIFTINASGVRESCVYVRSKEKPTDDDINVPYIIIKERIISELDQAYQKAQEQKQLLRRG